MTSKEYLQQWRELHPDKVKEYAQEWKRLHPDYQRNWIRLHAKKYEHYKTNNLFRIKYKGKTLRTKKQRTGVCNRCRAITGIDCNHTQWHHEDDLYNLTDISKNTIELCPSCHAKETGLGVKIRRGVNTK